MKLFRRRRRIDGLRAFCFHENELRVVHLKRSGGAKPVVTLAAAQPYDGNGPKNALTQLSRQWQDEEYQCTALVNASQYKFLPVEAPNVPISELKAAISWLIRDMIDFSIDEATVDVLSIPQEKNAAQRSRAMYAVAIRTELIGKLNRRFEGAKIPLRVIDIPEMAQRNIAGLLETADRGVALISFDSDGGLLTFSSGGELYLSRRIDVRLDQLLQADPSQREQMHERVALEIQRSLDHFSRHFSAVVIGKLVVAPLADNDGGLSAYLAHNLDAVVEPLEMESVIDLSRVPDLMNRTRQQQYFMTIGAALRVEGKAL